MRFRIVLEYEGTAFEGWQIQRGRRTVQGEVEAALLKLLGHPVTLWVSGRTDSGVSALAQVAAFDSDADRDTREIRDGLNAWLPDEVACVSAEIAPPNFDPRRWSWGKRYRYVWLDRPTRSPLRRNRAWHIRNRLDVEAMVAAAAPMVGRHDFSAFRSAGCAAAHPNRKIDAFDLTRQGDEVWLDVHGQGFLRHMVRIVAGTLTEVGLGRQPVTWPAEVLASKDRSKAGRTAPAHGLTLMEVRYEAGPPPWVDAADD